MKTNGTPIFGEWDSYFLAETPTFYKRESQTPNFKILVRTLETLYSILICGLKFAFYAQYMDAPAVGYLTIKLQNSTW